MINKIGNEKALMKCNLLDVLACIKKLALSQKYLQIVIADDTVCIKKRLAVLKKMLLSDDYSEKDASGLLIYIETYRVLSNRLKNCTDLGTLKEDNRTAKVRIDRLSKIAQIIGHRAPSFNVVGSARVVGSNRVQIL